MLQPNIAEIKERVIKIDAKNIELKTIFNTKQNEDDLAIEHNFVITSLGLNTLEKIPNSYSDLIINEQKLLE